MGERPGMYGRSVAERLADSRGKIEAMVHHDPIKEHSTNEIISLTNPDTGAAVEIVWTRVSRDGQDDEWCYTLRAREGFGADWAAYYQTGADEATYAPPGGGELEWGSTERFVEMAGGVEEFWDVATQQKDLLCLNGMPVNVISAAAA